jgi:hypothetical protein
MLESPVKRITPAQKVRFDNIAKTVTPLKGVLKKPEVVIRTMYVCFPTYSPFALRSVRLSEIVCRSSTSDAVSASEDDVFK